VEVRCDDEPVRVEDMRNSDISIEVAGDTHWSPSLKHISRLREDFPCCSDGLVWVRLVNKEEGQGRARVSPWLRLVSLLFDLIEIKDVPFVVGHIADSR
jgi:hypothetical protein